MNKSRKTSNLYNVITYDDAGNIVVPAGLTLGTAPESSDNSAKAATTAWIRTYVSGLSYATAASVASAIAALVDAAPTTLDTLNELAAALGDDPNFATTVTTSIGTKVPQARTITINGTAYDLSADRSWTIAAGLTSFNTRTGAITLTSGDVTTALGFTPYNATNPSGYITGITSGMVTTALGFTPYNSTNPSGYITGITSGMVTTALGYTPYNSSNPSGYITTARDWFGAMSTGGTADWNHVSNTRPGTGYSLLLGNGTNGPGPSIYMHPFNLEYSSKDGTGNVTQMAIAYGTPGNELYMRGRYDGSWVSWVRFWNSSNFNPSLYYTGSESDARYVNTSGDTISGTLTVTGGGNNGSGYGLISRDITAARSATSGVIYLGSDGNRYLYYNGSEYVMPGANLVLNGGALVNNTDGAVLMESNGSENNNWLWKEASKSWGLFWFNRGSQAGQTIGGYSTVGAELMFMGGNTGIAMPTGWTGYQSGSYVAAMISNYNGYIYSASTIYAATSMIVGGNTVIHAGNISSYTAGAANSVAWANISGGTRSNYNLVFRPDADNYAGFTFTGANGVGSGYLLIRGASDSDIYTANGITLVADQGWLTLAQRTSSTGGIRFSTGTTAIPRMEISNNGVVRIDNNIVIHAGNYPSYLDPRYVRRDTTSQFLKPYYEYSSYLGNDAPSTLASQMSGGGMRVDFMGSGGSADGSWSHVITFSGYNRYSMSQIGTNYNTTNARLYYRQTNNHDDAWASWKEFVFTNTAPTFSNVYAGTFYMSNSTSKYVTNNGSSYGSLYIGGSQGGYSGFRFDGDMQLMMHTNGAAGPCGFWLNNWSILTYVNSAQYLYHNGSEKFRTDSGGIYVTGTVYATGDVIAYYSDIRLKKDVTIIDSALSKIQQLRGVTYTWNDEEVNKAKDRAGTRDIGLIAQEVEAVEPLLITEYQTQLNTPSNDPEEAKNFVPEMSETYKTIKYEKLVALLIEGVKEQQTQIESQGAQITELMEIIKKMKGL